MERSGFGRIARSSPVGTVVVGVTFDRDQLTAQSSEYISYKGVEVNEGFTSITVTNPAIVDLCINIDADPGDADTIAATEDGIYLVPPGSTITITAALIKRVRLVIPMGPTDDVYMVLGND